VTAAPARPSPRFELGINWWPRRSAMYMWQELELAEVREEMAHMADMGFDVVRLFAMTRDFVPAALTVDAAMIGRLVDVVRAAADAGLRVVPTLVVINMSGRIWWPDWMLDAEGRPGSLWTDPTILRSQELLAEEVAGALAGSATIRAIDLTNEVDDAQKPPSRAAARTWTETLAGAVRRHAPGVPVQVGAHLPWLADAGRPRVDDTAAIADEDVMHAYPLYSDVARSFLDPELVPFSCALTSALAGKGRPTLMQEFGLCTAAPGAGGVTITDDFLGSPRQQYLAAEADASAYYHVVLTRLAATGAAGAYAWCYADYDRALWTRPPFDTAIRERTFGLVRPDGSEKPACGTFRTWRRLRDAGLVRQGPVPDILDVGADEYHRDPAAHFARLYARWIERHARAA
jgi:endo-1,4-beta-mannosidase